MKILYSVAALSLAVATQAHAGPLYDCYQAFDSFPLQTKDTHLIRPFYILPLQSEDRSDRFMILNESGEQIVKTTSIVKDLKKDPLTVTPPGEKKTVEIEYLTYSDHVIENGIGYPNPAEKCPPAPHSYSSIHADFCSHPTVLAPEKVPQKDLKADLKYAIGQKIDGNLKQISNGATLNKLKAEQRADRVRISGPLQTALRNVDGCLNLFPGDADIIAAVKNQKDVLNQELTLIADLNNKKKGPQTFGTPETAKPATSAAPAVQ